MRLTAVILHTIIVFVTVFRDVIVDAMLKIEMTKKYILIKKWTAPKMSYFNSFLAKLSYLSVRPLEFVFRHSDPQF